jgi:hypothetical protein
VTAVATERWAPIHGYEDHYAASSLGDIHGLPRRAPIYNRGREFSRFVPPKILRPAPRSGPNKRRWVKLCRDGIRADYEVGRLVLEAFTEPRPDRRVEYIDGDTCNTRLDNLRWSA